MIPLKNFVRVRLFPITVGASLLSQGVLYAFLQQFLSSQEEDKPDKNERLNVHGQRLKVCSTSPITGYLRNGYCETVPQDKEVHVVCAQVTEQFLNHQKSRENDLITPTGPRFTGLKPGDKWCLCASRWDQAFRDGVYVKVDLDATNEVALQYNTLQEYQSVPM